jgi:hypothetical protein
VGLQPHEYPPAHFAKNKARGEAAPAASQQGHGFSRATNSPTHFLRNQVRGEAAIKPIVGTGRLCITCATQNNFPPRIQLRKLHRHPGADEKSSKRQMGVFHYKTHSWL